MTAVPLQPGRSAGLRQLTRREQALIRFCAQHANVRGEAYEVAVWGAFGIGMVRFGQLLNRLMWLPEAEAFDAVTVRRYRRVMAGTRRKQTVEQSLAEFEAIAEAAR